MTTKVHILASCFDDPRATTLVFRTLRTGFPTAEVVVWKNRLSPAVGKMVNACAKAANCAVLESSRIRHDEWINRLLEASPDPFWICDTDIVFHASVEGFSDQETLLKGRYEPPFREPWSGTRKTERLHTSLLFINAPMVRIAVREWIRRWHPKNFPFEPMIELVRQCYVPSGANLPPLFQDTCAGLYRSIGGERFSEDENKAFDHLHCGTYVNLMKDAVQGLAAAHQQVYDHPEMIVEMREAQAHFYLENAYAP